MSSSPNQPRPTVAYIGASRGVGYEAFLALAKRRLDIHSLLLVRDAAGFKSRDEFLKLPEDIVQRTTIVEGDAWNVEDVNRLLRESGDGLESVVYSAGPHDHHSALHKLVFGMTITPKDHSARGVIALLKAVAARPTIPKIVFVSSSSMGIKGRASLPFVFRVLYKYYLDEIQSDKLAGELAILKALLPPDTSSTLPRHFPEFSELPPSVISQSNFDALPSAFLDQSRVLIVRPSALTDGPAKGWSSYRIVQEGEKVRGGRQYFISRANVGGFIAAVLYKRSPEGADKWWGHQVVLGY